MPSTPGSRRSGPTTQSRSDVLVDMVPLRAGSRIRPRDEVINAKPTRGHLLLTLQSGLRRDGQPDITATLNSREPGSSALELRRAVVTRMRGDSFLVCGSDVELPRGIGGSRTLPQVW